MTRSPLQESTSRHCLPIRRRSQIYHLPRWRSGNRARMFEWSVLPSRKTSMRLQYVFLFDYFPSGPRERLFAVNLELSDLDNPCLTKPCLNGGECIADGASYQCRCTLGYDGEKCDLDARVCQTQFPCGQGLGVHCQSFSFGASLNYVCIFENGRAYGPTPQRSMIDHWMLVNMQRLIFVSAYQNPCQGTHTPQPLAFTDEGFILCNGDRMFVESCPLGTVWNDAMKACGWEDESAEETEVPIEKPQGSSIISNRSSIYPRQSRAKSSAIQFMEFTKYSTKSGSASRNSSSWTWSFWNTHSGTKRYEERRTSHCTYSKI